MPRKKFEYVTENAKKGLYNRQKKCYNKSVWGKSPRIDRI
jgi:hypothetical protein